jgi:anti-sigma-K factor RskA
MAMKHRQLTEALLETASLYAAGALPESERRNYALHLEADGCELCRAEVLELQSAMHSFAIDLPASTPSPAVKMRLMAQAELTASMRGLQNQPPRRSYEWVAWLISAAATAALIAVLMLNSSLRKNVESLSTRVAELESQMVGQRTTLAALTSPRVRVLDLAGQGTALQAVARVFWIEKDHRWLIYVSELPQVSKDRTYQLWFVPKNGAPRSASVFNTNPDGSAMFEIPVPANIGELKAAAVTTEPAGGLPQPSGSFVLLGAL